MHIQRIHNTKTTKQRGALLTSFRPLTKEDIKSVLHVKWISDKKREWWRIAGNPVSFAGNPPRQSVPYESKYIQMFYADDVRSAIEGYNEDIIELIADCLMFPEKDWNQRVNDYKATRLYTTIKELGLDEIKKND